MRQWQKEALLVIHEARAHATRTSDKRLHLACCSAIDAMVMEGGQVPSELRIYARQLRELYGTQVTPKVTASALSLRGDGDGPCAVL